MDAWGIDVVLTASQKGLGVPPGLSILVASEKAMKVCTLLQGDAMDVDTECMHRSLRHGRALSHPTTGAGRSQFSHRIALAAHAHG